MAVRADATTSLGRKEKTNIVYCNCLLLATSSAIIIPNKPSDHLFMSNIPI